MFFFVEFPDDLLFESFCEFVDSADFDVVLGEIVTECGLGDFDLGADVFHPVAAIDDVVGEELHLTARGDAVLDEGGIFFDHASVVGIVVHDVPDDDVLIFLGVLVFVLATEGQLGFNADARKDAFQHREVAVVFGDVPGEHLRRDSADDGYLSPVHVFHLDDVLDEGQSSVVRIPVFVLQSPLFVFDLSVHCVSRFVFGRNGPFLGFDGFHICLAITLIFKRTESFA